MCTAPSAAKRAAQFREQVDAKRAEDEAKRLLIEKDKATDVMSAEAIAARQHQAQQTRSLDGMRSTYLTSTRGLEGVQGAGLKGPPPLGADLPIIATSDATPEAQKKAEEETKRNAARAGAGIRDRNNSVSVRLN
jgi:hypothetical protein